jgi:plastocyanin
MKWILSSSLGLSLLVLVTAVGAAETSMLTGSVNLIRANGSPRTDSDTGIVVWLTPVPKRALPPAADRSAPVRPTIVQRNKRFETRLLVVEVGTTVDFPNKDNFFHNVFSLYDGKKFDLGLYEAGKTKHVQFNRAGVCYIFCNIHSQMSAVVVVVESPYFVKLTAPGEFRIPELPLGQYELNVWAERCSPETLKAASRRVAVNGTQTAIGTIQLRESRDLMTVHPNKHGKDYEAPVFSGPIYAQP